ncbi:MAG: cytochrome b/b6 domain-containing protein [Deltaproteobacteria bacterium]|nr:cytochrome b/b6 domain-containing protein [Deltaproteobacteria bacterium]
MQPNSPREEMVRRFSVLHRFLHLVVLIGFSGLAITGLSLAFSDQFWARAVMWVLGGSQNAGNLHRFLAVMTYACVVVHLVWFFYYKLVLKGKWKGPYSLLPRMQDFKDMSQHFRFFFARRGTPPEFDKFSYVEKFDYWAFFLGMNTMGLTGLVLWFPESFSSVLPGYFVNLAQVLHLYEAIMAVTLKIVIHMVTVHFRPEVYPVDTSIFTGKITVERMKKDHAGVWEDYVTSKQESGASGK